MNKKSWHRLTLSLFGILLVWLIWYHAIGQLRDFPAQAIAAFTTLTVNTQYVIGAIVIFMVTGRLVYEWRMNTISQISEIGEQIAEKIERVPAPKNFDDGTIP